MPLRADLVGRTSPPAVTQIDARWLMAYAAGLGEAGATYLDTLRGVVAHPMFPVCVEWNTGQAISPPGPTGLTDEEARRGVHYAHDLTLHQPLVPGTTAATTSEVVAIRSHRAGALMVTRIDAEGLWTTWTTSLFRDVEIDGEERSIGIPPVRPDAPPGVLAVAPMDVDATRAHVYTECARIWNPIHTDPAVAAAAGLPGIILHGTATLATGVSRVLDLVDAGPERVRRVAGTFGAMVMIPSSLEVRLLARVGPVLHFDVRTTDGRPAVRDGLVVLAD